jgi:hypothetical protein
LNREFEEDCVGGVEQVLENENNAEDARDRPSKFGWDAAICGVPLANIPAPTGCCATMADRRFSLRSTAG